MCMMHSGSRSRCIAVACSSGKAFLQMCNFSVGRSIAVTVSKVEWVRGYREDEVPPVYHGLSVGSEKYWSMPVQQTPSLESVYASAQVYA